VIRFSRYLLVSLPALPALVYWILALQDALGANPVETLLRALGEWSLVGLCLTLTVSPLSKLLKRPHWVVWRRRLGLWTFAYVLQHALVYVVFDMPTLGLVLQDIVERPFIAAGFASALILMALAATSFARARVVLGPLRWKRLHQLVFVAAALSLLHFYWMRAGKNDFADVWFYGLWLVVVLALRGYRLQKSKVT
jgi:methionine sulfoxide reductase heme-binding subunit